MKKIDMSQLKYKIAYALTTFMTGRYGSDDLYKDSFILYLILLVLNIFIGSPILSGIISGLMTLIVISVLFRYFSKNVTARQKENAKYLILKNKAKNKFGVFKKRFSDKTHVYRKCPSCKATLRFPRKKGTHSAVCPKCHKDFKVKIIF